MGTRAVIKIKDYGTACLYKHWDGYPEATLEWLEEFNKEFSDGRGNDNTYKFAQLVRSSVLLADKYNLDQSKLTGWGVYPANADVGQEYEYILCPDGSVKCNKV